jgi:hypothetical protein
MALWSVGPSGGIGGDAFNDEKLELSPGFLGNSFVNAVDIFWGQFVNAIRFTVINATTQQAWQTPWHGLQNVGNAERIVLAPDEFIVAIRGKAGRYVDSISIHTRTSTGMDKSYGSFGGPGGEDFEYEAPLLSPTAAPDIAIVGLFGGAGQIIDSLGVLLQRPLINGHPG